MWCSCRCRLRITKTAKLRDGQEQTGSVFLCTSLSSIPFKNCVWKKLFYWIVYLHFTHQRQHAIFPQILVQQGENPWSDYNSVCIVTKLQSCKKKKRKKEKTYRVWRLQVKIKMYMSYATLLLFYCKELAFGTCWITLGWQTLLDHHAIVFCILLIMLTLAFSSKPYSITAAEEV